MDAVKTLLRHNVRNNLLNGIAWSIGFNFVTPFIPVLAGKLGATNTDFALLASVPALMSILVTLPASVILDRFRRQKRIIAGTIVASRLCYLLMALIPLLHFSPIEALIVLVGIYNATNAVISVAYQSMMGEVIPLSYRNRVFAQRNVWTGFTGMAVALAAGWGIDRIGYPFGYQAAFTLGFIASLAETWYFNKLRIPSEEQPAELSGTGTDSAVASASVSSHAGAAAAEGQRARSWRERYSLGAGWPFYLFCASAVIFIFTWQGAWPIYNKVKVVTLHATNAQMSVNAVLGALGSLLAFPLWAKLAERRGNGIVVFLSALLLGLTPLCWVYAPSMNWVTFYDFIGGIATGGFNQAVFNRLLELVPASNRQRAIALYTTLSQVSAIFAPIVGMQLYGHVAYIPCMIDIGVARVVGSLCFLLILLPAWLHRRKARSSADRPMSGL
jgi:MFS family permease